MPVLGLAILLMQIAFAVHAIRNGKEIFWVFIIAFVPLLGCAIYFFVEILPQFGQSRAAREMRSTLDKAMYAERDYRALLAAVEELPTPHNKHLLASELIRRGDYVGARRLYESALLGPHVHDPALLMGLARALVMLDDPAGALDALDRLQAANPGFHSHEGHLLYARALAALGRAEDAEREYAALVPQYPGQEARARFALLLQQTGREREAAELSRPSSRRSSAAGATIAVPSANGMSSHGLISQIAPNPPVDPTALLFSFRS